MQWSSAREVILLTIFYYLPEVSAYVSICDLNYYTRGWVGGRSADGSSRITTKLAQLSWRWCWAELDKKKKSCSSISNRVWKSHDEPQISICPFLLLDIRSYLRGFSIFAFTFCVKIEILFVENRDLIGRPDNDIVFWLAGLTGAWIYSIGYVVCSLHCNHGQERRPICLQMYRNVILAF